MLKNLLAMAGLDEGAIEKLKVDATDTAAKLQAAEVKLNIIADQVAEMHAAFFQMVPRPQQSQPIQDAELINDEQVERVGDVIELNTPETAFKVN